MPEDQKEYKTQAPDRLPVEVRAQMLSKETSLYFNLAKFEHAQRIATLFSSSTMVPQHFQGNVANCLIALNYADRIQADPFLVMQNIYIVHGRPGIEAKLVIALINQSHKYAEPLKFRFDGDGENYGCTAWTKEAKSGEVVEGPKVTRSMVKAEGWDSKAGTKWKTIPELMFRYRAASWFANVHCPELKLGMATVEEIHDFVELQETKNGKWTAPEAQAQPVTEQVPWRDEILALADEFPLFSDFVKATIQANRSTEAELRISANSNPAAFIAAFNVWADKQQNATEQPRQRKPIADKVQPRKPPEPPPDPPTVEHEPERSPGDEPDEPQQGESAGVWSEEMELDALRDELRGYEHSHKYHVLEAKARTGISHATTIDGLTRLIEEVKAVIDEKTKTS